MNELRNRTESTITVASSARNVLIKWRLQACQRSSYESTCDASFGSFGVLPTTAKADFECIFRTGKGVCVVALLYRYDVFNKFRHV
jgi:hypothetical protein